MAIGKWRTGTDASRTYYTRCKRILEDFEEANHEAIDASATASGVLRIAAPVTFGTLHMGEIVARFMQDHPKVKLTLGWFLMIATPACILQELM